MRIPDEIHRTRDWRVHELANDFALHDVWRFPVRGNAHEFDRFVTQHERGIDRALPSGAAGALFRLRSALGVFLDADPSGVRVRDRLDPAERAHGDNGPFQRVYRDEHECLYELSNRTVHALLHLGWVPIGGDHTAEMAVYVKPRGWFGRAYMALIDPFRHAIVYPALMRAAERRWVTA
ncbi:MAG: DUF2867 domain-containing protein [Myxococcota bacterium]